MISWLSCARRGTTILLVDQMAALALSVADRAYVLQSGTIRQGAVPPSCGDPAVVQAYLGEQDAGGLDDRI
jgi:ABC-type branched-subunit amino acid transport system ATPase component